MTRFQDRIVDVLVGLFSAGVLDGLSEGQLYRLKDSIADVLLDAGY
jgi:hypothetical protein